MFILFICHSCTSHPQLPGGAVPSGGKELLWAWGPEGHRSGPGVSQSVGPKESSQSKPSLFSS